MPYFVPPRYTADVDPLVAALLASAASQDLPHHHFSTPKPAAKKPCKPTNRSIRAFTPNFDVFKTPSAYILEGELPGLADKKALDIEFIDDRTLLVRGRIERPAFKSPEAEAVAGSASTSLTTTTEESRRSLNPTVEDTDDEDDFSVVSSSKPEEENMTKATKESQKKPAETKKPQRKTWVSERMFGHFQRMFEFPTSVEVEEVQAALEAGVLHITVPKRVAKGPRKIEIQ